jgi:hypothetical protein
MPTSRTITPDPPVPPEALVAAVPASGKTVLLVDEVQEFMASAPAPSVATAELVDRIRRLGKTRVVLRNLSEEDVVRVLGEG